MFVVYVTGITVSRLSISALQLADSGTLQCASASDYMDVRVEVVESMEQITGDYIY